MARRIKIEEHALEVATMALKPDLPDLTPDGLRQALAKWKEPPPLPPEEDRLITVREGARLLAVSRRTLDSYIARGLLRKVKLSRGGVAILNGEPREIGGCARIHLSEILGIMNGRLQ